MLQDPCEPHEFEFSLKRDISINIDHTINEDNQLYHAGLEESKRGDGSKFGIKNSGGRYQEYMGAKYIKGHHDQDFATFGSGDNFHYVIVADGHGPRGNVVKLLKEIDWKGLLSSYHDDDDLLNQINGYIMAANISDIRDGSTLSIVKILPIEGKIHAYWIGDSQLVIRKTNVIGSNSNSIQEKEEQQLLYSDDQDNNSDDEESMQVEIEETETVSSTAFHTNPSSEFLIGEGTQLNNNTNEDDDFDNETEREMNSNEFIAPSVTLIKPEMHNKNNETEIQRLRENNVRTENSRAPLVLSPTDITMVESLYFNHQILGQTAKVNLTRSLGHCIRKKNSFSYSVFSSSGGSIQEETELVYATLQKFDTLTTDYNPMKDNVEVLVASDGFWDMVADDEIHSLLNEMECAWRRKQIANETTEGRETLNQQEGLTGIENDVQEEEIILKEDEMENGAHTLDKFALKGRENSSREGIKVRGGIDKYKADASELESDKRIEDFYVQFANDRWKQMWNYKYKNFPPQVTKFEEGDDIGVAVFSSYVLQKPN